MFLRSDPQFIHAGAGLLSVLLLPAADEAGSGRSAFFWFGVVLLWVVYDSRIQQAALLSNKVGPLTGSASVSQEKFSTRHELALLRVSALTGVVMFAGMTSLFHTQLTGILTVSPESCKTHNYPADGVTARVSKLLELLILTYYSFIWVIFICLSFSGAS